MTFLKYLLLTLFALSVIFTLIFAIKSRKPIKFLLLNAFLGISTLLILYFTRKITGVFIAINPYTIFSASVCGIPSVILILFLNFFILV